MLDIILYAPGGKADLVQFAKNHPPANPLLQDDGEGNPVTREGVDYCWWAGSGKFMTAKGEYDGEGNEIVPPSFAPGVVALLRIDGSFFENTKLADQEYDEEGVPQLEQHQRSAVVNYIRNNGTPGTMTADDIPYYDIDGVRLLRPQDVDAFVQSRNIPGHIWVGGNSY